MPTIGRRSGRAGRVAENLQAVIDTILKQKIQEESQTRQAQFVADRQREHDERMGRQQEAQRAFQADQNKRTGLGSILTDVDNATTLENMPSASGIIGRMKLLGEEDPHFRGGGPVILGQQRTAIPDVEMPSIVQQGIQAANAKRASIEQELGIKDAARERIGPDGVKVSMDRSGNPLQLERTAKQEGERARDVALGGNLSPEVRQASAAKVGAESFAREAGGIGGQFANIDKVKALAQARDTTGGGSGADPVGIQGAMQDVNKIIDLATSLNTQQDGTWARIQGLKQQAEALTGYNPAAKELSRALDYSTARLARLAGNSAQMTENDEKRIRARLPNFGLTTEENRRISLALKEWMAAAVNVRAQFGDIDPALSESEKQAEFSRRLDLIDQMIANRPRGGQSAQPGRTLTPEQFDQLFPGGQ